MRGRTFRIFFMGIACFLVLCPPATLARADESSWDIVSYRETVTIQRTGAADVVTVIDLADYGSEDIVLPLNYIWVEKISARFREGNEPLTVEIVNINGMDYVRVAFGKARGAGKHLVVTYRDPAYLLWKNAGPEEHGIYKYKSEFLNTTPLVIAEFALEVVLPQGYVVHKITKSKPEFTKKDPAPPYSYRNEKDGSHLMISGRRITVGKSVALEYTFVKKRTSVPLLIGGLILMGLLLYLFRDVLREKSHGR